MENGIVKSYAIRDIIYNIRNKQVMMDSDLAILYNVETKNLNKAVKRNKDRFPESFCFQLTKEEFDNLRFQIGTSSLMQSDNSGYGGRRYMPYVFTESGIAMLSAVLKSEVAVNVSVEIMKAFVEMRRFMTSNSLIVDKINSLEIKQIEYQKNTDEKFDVVFNYISEHAESEQKIFFEGQIFDAFSLLISIIQKAQRKIIVIDNYVDVSTLNILSKKNENVNVLIITVERTRLSHLDVERFNLQYPFLEIKYSDCFHDRFIVVDDTTVYNVGSSLKDAGRKCFAINMIKDEWLIKMLLGKVFEQMQ